MEINKQKKIKISATFKHAQNNIFVISSEIAFQLCKLCSIPFKRTHTHTHDFLLCKSSLSQYYFLSIEVTIFILKRHSQIRMKLCMKILIAVLIDVEAL